MAGIFDNFNTPIPNLVSGGNLIGSTLSLSDAYNKLFGTGKGGVLDFLNDQQEEIRKRNTQDMTQRMKSLTPDQLRQIEDAGLNPYTDLPAMYGANNGVIVDTEKAFEGANTAGANLVAANNNTLNTMYNQLTPLERADLLTKEGDYTQNMLELFKEKGNRPGLRFYDDKAFRMNADTAYKKGYDTLLDQMEKTNASNTDYKNSDSYTIPANVSPELEKQLRLDLATKKRNRAVTEAAYTIKAHMKDHPEDDWKTSAIKEGIPEDLWSDINLSELNDPYDNDYLRAFETKNTQRAKIDATNQQLETERLENAQKERNTLTDMSKDARKKEVTQGVQDRLNDILKNGITDTTFADIEDLKREAVGTGLMTVSEFNEYVLSHSAFSSEVAKYTDKLLKENKQQFSSAFEMRDKKYNLENMNTAVTQIVSNIKTTLENGGVPKELIPAMVQHVISQLNNDLNVGKLSNFNSAQQDYVKAAATLEAESSHGGDVTDHFYNSLKENKIPDPFDELATVKGIVKDRIDKVSLNKNVGANWDRKFGTGSWSKLGPAGQNYVLFSLMQVVKGEKFDAKNESKEAFTQRVISALENNVESQGANLLAPAQAVAAFYKARNDLSMNSVAPTKVDSK